MHFITGDNLQYITSVLNSKLLQWLLNVIIGEAAGGNAGNADNILNLHIPKHSDDINVNDEFVYNLYRISENEIAFIESQQNQ